MAQGVKITFVILERVWSKIYNMSNNVMSKKRKVNFGAFFAK